MYKETLYVVLPCYNEGLNIPGLIKQWKSLEDSLLMRELHLEIIIVNDGSDMDTLNIINSMEVLYDNVRGLHHNENKGLGEALNTGINRVLSNKEEGLLCVMDGDMTHPPEYVLSMIDKLRNEGQDCVIASRYRKGSRVEGLSGYRKCLSLCARLLYTLRFKISGSQGLIRDYTCGYRLYKTEMLRALYRKFNERIITENGFACMVELLVKIGQAGYRICEVPFVLKYHLKGGESKMRIFRTINRSLYLVMKY